MLKIAKQQTAKQQTFTWTNILEVQSPLVELFLGGIKEAYWAKNHLVRTLLKMMNAASSGGLQHVLNNHIERTKSHTTKLEHIFELLDETIDATRNDSIAGLSIKANEVIECTDEGTATRDLAIILVFQQITQFEIATYGGLISAAATIGRNDLADIFNEILDDETECMKHLISQNEIITLKAVRS